MNEMIWSAIIVLAVICGWYAHHEVDNETSEEKHKRLEDASSMMSGGGLVLFVGVVIWLLL